MIKSKHCNHRRRQSFQVRGTNVKPGNLPPENENENSSDLVHYFFRGPKLKINK